MIGNFVVSPICSEAFLIRALSSFREEAEKQRSGCKFPNFRPQCDNEPLEQVWKHQLESKAAKT